MNDVTLTENDKIHVTRTVRDLRADESEDSTVVMLSFGYADVYPDGAVVAYGRTVATVEPEDD